MIELTFRGEVGCIHGGYATTIGTDGTIMRQSMGNVGDEIIYLLRSNSILVWDGFCKRGVICGDTHRYVIERDGEMIVNAEIPLSYRLDALEPFQMSDFVPPSDDEKTEYYVGQNRDDHGCIHGRGMVLYNDGSAYAGDFRHGLKHGMGYMIDTNGTLVYGTFVDGVQSGMAYKVEADGFISITGFTMRGMPGWNMFVPGGRRTNTLASIYFTTSILLGSTVKKWRVFADLQAVAKRMKSLLIDEAAMVTKKTKKRGRKNNGTKKPSIDDLSTETLPTIKEPNDVTSFSSSKEPTKPFPEPPDEFVCSITHELMVDPVVIADGYTYERRAIETWIQRKATSPRTGQDLDCATMFQNHNLRRQIMEWREGSV